MKNSSFIVRNVMATVCAWSLVLPSARAADPVTPAEQKPAVAGQDAVTKEATANGIVGQLIVTVGKSLIIDSPMSIKRFASANGNLVDIQPISPKEFNEVVDDAKEVYGELHPSSMANN